MKNALFGIVVLLLLVSCKHKEIKQGTLTYDISYRLPDSLKRYADYLPKSAIVFFKGDSTVNIQQAGDEATTVITNKPTNFMRVLLRSSAQKIVIDYNKADQAEELPAKLGYSYTNTKETKTIAGHKASRYMLIDKFTGDTSEVWFTKELSVIPNSMTMTFDTVYGFPVAFTIRQNGILTVTNVKSVKFETVPEGVFSTPAGYKKITPKQLRDMPINN